MNLINKLIVNSLSLIPELVARPLAWPIAKNYIAGPSCEDAFRITRQFNTRGIKTEIDFLGEEIKDIAEADHVVEEYLQVIHGINKHNLCAGISCKPTQFGLLLNKRRCLRNLYYVAKEAAKYNITFCFDMEDHRVTTNTIALYIALRDEFGPVIRVAIQAYLWRTINDITMFGSKDSLRLCNGAYIEPEKIAIKDRYAINENFNCCLKRLIEQGCFVGIATHDLTRIIKAMHFLILSDAINRAEFQTLLGVKPWLCDIIIGAGFNLAIYTAFGKPWYPFFIRRAKENPQLIQDITRGYLKEYFLKRKK